MTLLVCTPHQLEAVRQQRLLRARLECPHDEGARQALHQPDMLPPPAHVEQQSMSGTQRARPVRMHAVPMLQIQVSSWAEDAFITP